MICKTDDDSPKRVKKDDFVTVDVITCAAPNLRDVPATEYNPETGGRVQITPERLFALHLSRAEHIMHTAAHNGADILIIGAFGCGAFRNDPRIVAMAYCEALKKYRAYFDIIEFAVYCKDSETANHDAFCKAMSDAGYI